jgi:hypothetical protein
MSLLEVGSHLCVGRRSEVACNAPLQRRQEQRRGVRGTTLGEHSGSNAAVRSWCVRGVLPNHLRLSNTIIAACRASRTRCVTWARRCTRGASPACRTGSNVHRGSVSLLRCRSHSVTATVSSQPRCHGPQCRAPVCHSNRHSQRYTPARLIPNASRRTFMSARDCCELASQRLHGLETRASACTWPRTFAAVRERSDTRVAAAFALARSNADLRAPPREEFERRIGIAAFERVANTHSTETRPNGRWVLDVTLGLTTLGAPS